MAALLAWLHLRGEVELELGKVCDGILATWLSCSFPSVSVQ